ncbi:hypothetical protein BDL97_06G111000 [Sphagnum fallax]|nr:hypothetical protein BDL97_06G111000 [Sphagnum fallax]
MTKQDYYMFADDYYQRLAEGSDMSVDSTGSTPMSMSNGGNLVIISSMADSSVGSNNSVQTRPIADLHFQTATHNTSVVSYIVMLLGVAPPHTLGEDSSLGYEGAFGWLYRGTYNGDEVAVKILKRPENNIEKLMVMDSAFAKEVLMLATVKHQNVVQFVGRCQKLLVWCIVTEYAKGGSVRSFLSRWQSWAVSLKLA